MSELYRRLRTELSRSPKKSAFLALGLVVAVVFWGRVLWKPSDDVPVEAETVSATAPVGVVSLPSTSQPLQIPRGSAPGAGNAGANGASEPSWQDLLVWMRSTLDGNVEETSRTVERDPFEASDPTLATVSLTPEPEPGEEDAEANDESTEPTEPATDPIREAAAGLSVQGVLRVGSRRFVRLAGRSLGKGEAFELPGVTNDDGEPSVWIVQEIDGEGVVIRPSEEGEPLRLSLKKPELSGVRVEQLEKE